MNSHSFRLTAWATGFARPFYLAVIDGESRLSFVNSHFFINYQQESAPIAHATLRCLVDEKDRSRFDLAMTVCLQEERETMVEVRMRKKGENWVRWELRCLEAMGLTPGRLFCLGYDLSGEEAAGAAGEDPCAARTTHGDGGPAEWQKRLARQKELTYQKVREATIRAENQERTRMARELHDNVNQILTSAQLYLSCLNKENPDFEHVKTRTTEIIALAIEELRSLAHNIAPPALREKGLIESIQRLVQDLRYTRPFDITFHYTDLLTIETQDQQLKLTVFRIIQEQVRNICKYSQATQVQIGLQAANDQIRLQIADNGRGFDPKTTRRGLGLSHIQERAGLYKGKVLLNTAPGQGCTLVVTIPLEVKRIP